MRSRNSWDDVSVELLHSEGHRSVDETITRAHAMRPSDKGLYRHIAHPTPMPKPLSGLAETVLDQMQDLGPVACKRLFGGYGFSVDGLTFAIIIRDTLYFKVDDSNRERFETAGLARWVYQSYRGKPVKMPFYLAPDEVLDDSDAMTEWGRTAINAAHNVASKKKK